jgi:hypothetical protein
MIGDRRRVWEMPHPATVSAVTDSPQIRRRELNLVLEYLEGEPPADALVLGMPGVGKTVLLRMLGDELRQQGRSTVWVSLSGVDRPGEVGSRVVDAVTHLVAGRLDTERTLLSSAGAPPMSEVIDILRRAAAYPTRPVLLLDALDEAGDRIGTASTVAELSRAPTGWQTVVSSRWRPDGLFSDRYVVFSLDVLSLDAAALLRRLNPELTDQRVQDLVAFGGGLP